MPCKHFINVMHNIPHFVEMFLWHARLVCFQHVAMDMLSNRHTDCGKCHDVAQCSSRHVATLHAASCAEMLSEATLAASCKLASEGVEQAS